MVVIILVVQQFAQLVLSNLQIAWQSADWHTFCGSSVCSTQSADCANSQIAQNIYIPTHNCGFQNTPSQTICMSIKSHESHLIVNKGSVRGHDLTSLLEYIFTIHFSSNWAMNYFVSNGYLYHRLTTCNC